MTCAHNTCAADQFQAAPQTTDDLLYLLAILVRKAEQEPAHADALIAQSMRVFDRIVERMA